MTARTAEGIQGDQQAPHLSCPPVAWNSSSMRDLALSFGLHRSSLIWELCLSTLIRSCNALQLWHEQLTKGEWWMLDGLNPCGLFPAASYIYCNYHGLSYRTASLINVTIFGSQSASVQILHAPIFCGHLPLREDRGTSHKTIW